MVSIDLKDAYLSVPVAKTVSEVQMEGDTLRIPVPAIRPQQCPTSVHQTAETSGSSPQKTGHTLCHLPGRPANNAAHTESPGESCTGHSHVVPSYGLLDQLGEECSRPNTGDPVPGSQSGLGPDDSSPDGGQAEGYCSSMQSGQQAS